MDARFTRTNIGRLLAKAWLRFLPIGVGFSFIPTAETIAQATGLSTLSVIAIGIVLFGIGTLPLYERWANKQFGPADEVRALVPSDTIRWRHLFWVPIFLLLGAGTLAVFGYGLFPIAEWVCSKMEMPNSRAVAIGFTSVVGWTCYGVVSRATDIAVAWLEQ